MIVPTNTSDFNDYDKIIDNRNNTLWNEVNEHFTIDLFYYEGNHAFVNSEHKSAQLYLNLDIDPDLFTHELLHLWMGKNKITFGSYLKLWLNETPDLQIVFVNDLLDHIGNTIDHFLMFPRYLELGFDPLKFLHDASTSKCNLKELSIIKRLFRMIGIYNGEAIEHYIAAFFAMKSDHISRDYTNCLLKLKAINADLYSILLKFWKSISEYDIYNNDQITNPYYLIVDAFVDEMKILRKNKKIVR